MRGNLSSDPFATPRYPPQMRLIEDPHGLDAFKGCSFVPTMGALHEGHAALVRHAAASGRPCVVSVFVNPTQFGEAADLARYPRTLEADLALCERAGAAAVFHPAVEVIYPVGVEAAQAEARAWPLPAVAKEPGLEDAFRPGHFGGVCQVVARLFDLTRPASACFGEKDYQQLLVVRAMVAESGGRWGRLTIEACPTVREPDGLAMSSRNRFLGSAERSRALAIPRALSEAAGCAGPAEAEVAMRRLLSDAGVAAEYAVARAADSLMPTTRGPFRLLVAARVGAVRLIDNCGGREAHPT